MSQKMKPSDPAYHLLLDDFTSTPVVFRQGCYICNDPEFAMMGLPLCRRCPVCGGHVPADDTICDDCGLDEQYYYELTAIVPWHGNRPCYDFLESVHGSLDDAVARECARFDELWYGEHESSNTSLEAFTQWLNGSGAGFPPR
jgi:hypothetical protein